MCVRCTHRSLSGMKLGFNFLSERERQREDRERGEEGRGEGEGGRERGILNN